MGELVMRVDVVALFGETVNVEALAGAVVEFISKYDGVGTVCAYYGDALKAPDPPYRIG